MNDNRGPEIEVFRTTDGKQIEVCSNCKTPVPPSHSFQDASNRIWKKRACPSCGATFTLEGPYNDHQSANPLAFK